MDAPNILLIVTGIIQLAMPIARVKLSCHTWNQVVGGFILGFLIAIIFYIIERTALSKIPRYVDDKRKFYESFKF
jgi:membrane-associated phospholipid phosphatase